MLKYAKLIDVETGLCDVGLGTNTEFYKSIGMTELEVEKSEVDGNWYLAEKCPHYTEDELAQSKQQTFEKEFFSTSLGYIRRKVSMASGDTKDFLSDLLPAISAGVQIGQQIPIITYSLPDFTKDFSIEYMESLQEIKFTTAEFVQECFLQLSKDFAPVPLVINEGE